MDVTLEIWPFIPRANTWLISDHPLLVEKMFSVIYPTLVVFSLDTHECHNSEKALRTVIT